VDIVRPRRPRSLAIVSSAALIAAAAAACGSSGSEQTASGSSGSSGDSSLTQITVSTAPLDSCFQDYVARDEGFFKKHGLKADLAVVNGISELTASVQAGSANFACASPTQLASAYIQGIHFKVVAPGAEFRKDRPTTVLMVPNGSNIKSLADLKGKTIGIDKLNTSPHLGTKKLLEQHNVDPASVKFIQIDSPQSVTALKRGTVDAEVMESPNSGIAKSFAHVIGNPYAAINGGKPWYITVNFGTENYINAHAKIAHQFAAAMVDASKWMNDPSHDKAHKQLLTKELKEKPANLKKTVLEAYGTKLNPQYIQAAIDLQHHFGLIKDVNAKKLVWSGVVPS
jgi:NitT/TauT family transport system substrate-binding protein